MQEPMVLEPELQLLHRFLFTLLNCSLKILGTFLPQGLCIFFSFYLECCSLGYQHGSPLTSFNLCSQSPSQGTVSGHLVESATPTPPHQLSLPLALRSPYCHSPTCIPGALQVEGITCANKCMRLGRLWPERQFEMAAGWGAQAWETLMKWLKR